MPTATRTPAAATFLARAHTFLALRHAIAAGEAEVKALKPGLAADVFAHGTVDENTGHVTLSFGEVIDGYSGLCEQRREGLDPEAADRICTEHGLVAECATQWVAFADPAAVLELLRSTRRGCRLLEGSGALRVEYDKTLIAKAAAAGKLTAEEAELIAPPTWALVPVKAPAT